MKCPICNTTVPFSLEMHMIAAHGKKPMKETVTRFSAKAKKEKPFKKGRRLRPKSGARRPKPFSGA